MRTILVDDEPLALSRLENMLNEFDDIHVLGSYAFAEEALEAIMKGKPDVLFLDINMPGINGLTLAEHAMTASPEVIIIFITAHEAHAVKAFDLEVLDYVLKPISLQRLEKTVERIRQRRGLLKKSTERLSPPASELLTLHCMGAIRIQRPGSSPEPLKWRTTKAKDVFSYLFHHRGHWVRRDALLDLFWPDLHEQSAMGNLQTTMYRIRSLWKGISNSLPHTRELVTIEYISRGYTLELSHDVKIDTVEWEKKLNRLKPLSAENADQYRTLIEEYEGNYLGEEYTWAEIERSRLKARWLQQARQLTDYYEQRGLITEALSIYYKALELDSLDEETHFQLMKLYARLENSSSVHNQFISLQSILDKEMDAEPSEQVLAWYREWSQGH